jgi:hypothetical protein
MWYGSGVSDVTMNLSGPVSAMVVTDAAGVYRFSGLEEGTYTVTPSKSGCDFVPSSLTVSVPSSEVVNQNFRGRCNSR